MTTFTFALSLYAATLSTILFIHWLRLLIVRRKVRRQIEANNLSPEKQEFIATHPLPPKEQAIKDIEEELDGEVVRGFEIEMEREEAEGIEESVEDREWQEEEKTRQQRQGRGK